MILRRLFSWCAAPRPVADQKGLLPAADVPLHKHHAPRFTLVEPIAFDDESDESTPTGDAPRQLLQLHIELARIEPAIWRRVVVPDAIPLDKLHKVMQAAMGWTNSHMHEFKIGHSPVPKRIPLAKILTRAKSFSYLYDFGDNWDHRIEVEQCLPPQAYPRTPVCLAGANACPPEDAGGAWGYAAFLEAISNPRHPEHQAMLDWCGGAFDPLSCNLDAINRRLRRIKL